LAATALSVLIHIVQRRTFRRLETLRHQDEQHSVELERAFEAVRQSEERTQWLAKFPDQNPYPVLRVTRDGEILYANRASEGLLNLWGTGVAQLLPKDLQEVAARVLKTGLIQDIAVTLEDRVLSLTFAPLSDTAYVNIYGLDITEQKRAQKTLRDRERQLRLMFTQSLDGFFFMMLDEPILWDAETDREKMLDYVFEHQRITKVNDAMLEQYSATREQFLGLTPKDFFTHDLAQGKETWRAFFDKGRLHIETRALKFDGTPMWIEGDYICLRDDRGRITGHFGVQREVTARKRTEQALRASEARYRGLIESQHDLIIRLDPAGQLTFANDAYCKKFGEQRETLMGELFRPPIHPDDESLTPSDMKSLALPPYRANLEQRMLTDDEWRWIAWEYYAIRDDQGHTVEIQGVGRDITESKQAERALRESEETLRMLLEAAPEGIIIVNDTGRITMVNNSTEQLFGYQRAELLGQSIDILVPNWAKDTHQTHCAGYIANPHVRPMGMGLNLTALHRDGSEIPVEISLGYVRTMKGLLAMSFIMDITRRRQAKERQVKLLKELESVNRELKDFAYVVSHDLKAPLRAINSLAAWLSQDYADQLDEDGQELIDLLMNRVKRMHNLIEGVLQYSRVGRIQEEQVRIDMNQLIQDVIDLIVPPSNITITIAHPLPTITAERTRIAQVFQNLISNAVKYMDKPQGEIIIDSTDAGDFWQFSVADNGPGIEEKYFEKVFQLFQTLHPRDEFESTGVGLAVVKKTVELYGGNVWITSQVGEGSTFFLTLPQ
jgi:PAS domain S-box-containing protein